MSSTTVHSTQEIKHTTIAGTAFDLTEKSLVVPPEKQVYVEISSNIENESMEISVGDARVYENGTLEMQDGTISKMANAKAYQNMAKRRDEKAQMKAEAEQKDKQQEEVETR